MSKFAVTKENVEEIIDQIYEIYNGRFEKNVIRAFFGGWDVDPYPRSLEEAQCYESLYIEYYRYDEVEIVETKYLLR